MKIRIPINAAQDTPGVRVFVPAWLTDPSRPAPCHCGRPVQPGEPFFVVEHDTGLKRIFHGDCWMDLMGEHFDPGDDDE